jgi:primosomal protein N' (replication factor Y) (superfamily II helicase)
MKAGENASRQWEILLPTAAPHGFDYLAPADMSPGDIVSVPLGRGESLGVVWSEGHADIPSGKIKSVILHHDFPPLSQAMREFIDWAAWYNCAPKGAMLKMALPIADIGKKSRVKTKESPAPRVRLAELSAIQETAAAKFSRKLGEGFSVTLLDGVTGSGKTEVYFQAMAQTLAADPGNQVLVLLPEIALSVQWLARFEARFGFPPLIWNSEVPHAKKRDAWQKIVNGSARVVVGARSALFLPYKQLSLLVVDEEHDGSYKQEEGVIYHARDMAVARARFEKFPVALVSATPSLESYYNARQGKYDEILIPVRHAEAVLPGIEMLDMRSVQCERGAFISRPLREALANSIAQGHQAMLFLNRRGYAPLVLCRSCGHRFQCSKCSSWLVMHQSRPRLECHHCGFRMPLPKACPECKAEGNLHACGPGVERIHEEVKEFLPDARVAVMASDSMGGFKELSEVIEAMENKSIDLLIGTQMIAKGHHFADLGVVGVVDADLGLSGGDLRASERTYQLLHQLSGRAGRERIRGKVYLQSFLPEHPVMQALVSGDREAFMAAELQERKRAHMPPFSRLAAVIIEGKKEDQVVKLAQELVSRAHGPGAKIHVLGPAPAPFALLRGKYRYRLLVRADRNVNMPDFMREWFAGVKIPASLKVKADIDPMSFL